MRLWSKDMHALFQNKGKKMFKKVKIFEILGKNIQNLKIFWKRAGGCVWLPIARNKLLEKATLYVAIASYINKKRPSF